MGAEIEPGAILTGGGGAYHAAGAYESGVTQAQR